MCSGPFPTDYYYNTAEYGVLSLSEMNSEAWWIWEDYSSIVISLNVSVTMCMLYLKPVFFLSVLAFYPH